MVTQAIKTWKPGDAVTGQYVWVNRGRGGQEMRVPAMVIKVTAYQIVVELEEGFRNSKAQQRHYRQDGSGIGYNSWGVVTEPCSVEELGKWRLHQLVLKLENDQREEVLAQTEEVRESLSKLFPKDVTVRWRGKPEAPEFELEIDRLTEKEVRQIAFTLATLLIRKELE